MKMKLVLRAVAAVMVVSVALVGAQFYVTMKAVDSEREKAIQAWAKSNPDGFETVARYRELCQKRPGELSPESVPVSFVQCAEQVGSESLAAVIEHAGNSVEVPAPLRWL
ncbi:hypothetical protein [Halomonas sp. KO116]|uniref:hypothetical protein n=1 Tax=Halomonas sp. KO116 TaxID=1504981 RepID=UPI0004E3D9E5|nr:hypothetical protein [Halomonas sp. KO116]AJY53165.1 hypothetical protein KO116_P200058 [Halomonas sp. KO116]